MESVEMHSPFFYVNDIQKKLVIIVLLQVVKVSKWIHSIVLRIVNT